MYEILGQFFAGFIMLGTPLMLGILLGRYSTKFNNWSDLLHDFFN